MSAINATILPFRLRGLCSASALTLAAISSSIALAAPALAAGAQEDHSFSIPRGTLATSVLTFSEQAKVQVIAKSEDLKGLQSSAVFGAFTAREALTRLVRNAPVAADWVSPSTVTLRSRAVVAQKISLRPQARMAAVEQEGSPLGSLSPLVEDTSEIVVSARRREENPIRTPVVLSAVRAEELEQRGITSLNEVAQVIPQLVIGNSQSVQGGSISLRGIGGSESNPFADQAVSFSVDGIQIARATVQRMAQMDLAQIAVYKGPQALFFGKNSPAGVVDIRTADPTRKFDSRVSVGYGFKGNEVRGDGYISGPLTDTLSARLAFFGSTMKGYARNTAPASALYGPNRRDVPHDRELAGRLTLKFEPTSDFDAKLKVSYNRLRTEGPAENQQLVDCPLGVGQLSPQDDCQANALVVRPDLGGNFAIIDPRYSDGVPFLRQHQWLVSLEANYKLSDTLKLTSTTGYYLSSTKYLDTLNGSINPLRLLANYQEFKDKEFSQELRLASDFDGMVNFLVGGYYQHSNLYDVFIAALNAQTPAVILNYNNAATQKADAWSGFAQVMVNITPQLELSAGARYSYEKKRLSAEVFYLPVATIVPRRSFDDVSPEVSLTYRPSDDLTLFGAYKEGFLSGGFNVSAVDFTADRSYAPQYIKGGELGAKAALLDRKLRLNAAVYNYRITGLQVQSQVGITQVVTNAGKAKIEGAEFDLRWQAPVPGLVLTGAIAYNRARYQVYTAPCYAGQTPAQGCALNPSGTGAFRAQDLKGRPLVRAPEVVVSTGFDYRFPVSDGLQVSLNGNAAYTSKYFANPSDQPASLQNHYGLLDVGISLAASDDAWKLGLIGRNLTNKYYITRANDVTFTGSGTGTPAGVRADVSAVPSRGREIMLRATFNLGGLLGR